MTQEIIQYKSYNRLSCAGCVPADVIICITPDKVEPPREGYIPGQLQQVLRLQDQLGAYFYKYFLCYNTDDVVGGTPLALSDISGVFCKGCLTTYIDSKTNEVVVTLEVEDTDSVALTLSDGLDYTLSADVVIDPSTTNNLVTLETGLYVPQFIGTTGGAANTQTLVTSPDIAVLNGAQYTVIAGFTTTGAATLSIDADVRPIQKLNGRALINREIIAGRRYIIMPTSGAYILVNPSSDWQPWVPALTGFTSNPTDTAYQYRIDPDGNTAEAMVEQLTVGTSGDDTFTISAPVPAAVVTNGFWRAPLSGVDATSPLTSFGLVQISTGGTLFYLYKNAAGAAWTPSGGKSASFCIRWAI